MSKCSYEFIGLEKDFFSNKPTLLVSEGFLSQFLFENVNIERIIEGELNLGTEDELFNGVVIFNSKFKKRTV